MAKRVLHDRYFRQAKREGYLARSAYKLMELDDRRRFLRRGDRVLDLGCAPGSWLQVAGERIGPEGYTCGIDLNPASPLVPRHVRTVIGDFLEVHPEELLPPDGMLFDVVLSDMAPNTSGHGDHFRSVRLCEAITDRLGALLIRDGDLVMKVFEGEALPELIKHCRSIFRDVSVLKPQASRDLSKETFIIARGYRPGRDRGRPGSPGNGGGSRL
ncbi:MAG: RlmE family RNA methyltransferase [Planctomycetota bacterium]